MDNTKEVSIDDIKLEDLDDESLIELMEIFKGMKDEVEEEVDNNE